jgi:ABC-2 type transport system ATP-binding protein
VAAADTPEPAVLVRGLTKLYDGKLALDQLDMELAPGELRGLLGPNGAGKTTLLRALFGLIRPGAGSIDLLGRKLDARRRVTVEGVAGFVEDPTFYSYLSGRANLELLAELDDHHGPALDEALERVGLAGAASDRVGGYSTGMRQRLGIAAALLRSPRLLLLDEPTSGLDPEGIRAASALLRELAAGGVAVLISSHLIGELEAICDSYTIIHAGRVVWDGPASRLESEAPGSVYTLSTSDDSRALDLAGACDGVDASRGADARGIQLVARPDALDRYVIALGREGLAIRRLDRLVSPLEHMFFSLTGGEPDAPATAAWEADAPVRAA